MKSWRWFSTRINYLLHTRNPFSEIVVPKQESNNEPPEGADIWH